LNLLNNTLHATPASAMKTALRIHALAFILPVRGRGSMRLVVCAVLSTEKGFSAPTIGVVRLSWKGRSAASNREGNQSWRHFTCSESPEVGTLQHSRSLCAYRVLVKSLHPLRDPFVVLLCIQVVFRLSTEFPAMPQTDFDNLTYQELRQLCKHAGLDASGSRAVLEVHSTLGRVLFTLHATDMLRCRIVCLST